MSNYDLSAWPLFRSVIDETQAGAPKAHRCFFISPADDANPDVRRHAETLWKYVVRPALLDTDFTPSRIEPEAGALPGGGKVPQKAIDAILDDDLIIAVMSFRNPDVFYQAAIAQAAARPLILMVEEGQEVGFDPRGAQVLTYSLDTDSVLSAVNVKKLQAVIKTMAEMEAPDQPFRHGAGALNGGASGGATVYERSRQVTYDARLNMMREAKVRIDMMGLANMAFALHPDAIEAVRNKSGSGVEFRILQCAPANPSLGSLMNARDIAHLNAVKNEIEAAAEAWKRIVDMPDLDLAITVRRAQTKLPLLSALITDGGVVATPYLSSRVTAESPTMVANAGSAYHKVMQQEFDLVWSEAQTLFRAERRPQRGPAPANANFVRPGDPAGGLHSAGQGGHVTVEPAQPQSGQQSGGVMRGFSALRGLGGG
jgi:hypothetical protein